MRLAARLLLACLLGFGLARAATDPKLLLIEQTLNGFTDEDYAGAVEKLLAEHEARTGVPLRPGSLRKCGLKVSSESGVGLCTLCPEAGPVKKTSAPLCPLHFLFLVSMHFFLLK